MSKTIDRQSIYKLLNQHPIRGVVLDVQGTLITPVSTELMSSELCRGIFHIINQGIRIAIITGTGTNKVQKSIISPMREYFGSTVNDQCLANITIYT